MGWQGMAYGMADNEDKFCMYAGTSKTISNRLSENGEEVKGEVS